MSNFVNIHTHNLNDKNLFSIRNIFLYKNSISESYQSLGLHPWHLPEFDIEAEILKIEQNISNKNVIALGECGLDKLVNVDFDLQIATFEKIISLSEKYSKPIIIHCVKSYNEIINIRKETNLQIPWIIHGYNGNHETAKQLNDKNIYISVGRQIFNKTSKIFKSFKGLNLNFMFFESDDKEIEIEKLYEFASEILKIDVENLKMTVYENFRRIFNFFK